MNHDLFECSLSCQSPLFFLGYIAASPGFSFASISPIYILCLTLSSKEEHYGPHRPKICSQNTLNAQKRSSLSLSSLATKWTRMAGIESPYRGRDFN